MLGLRGKTALVTGASRGIGKAVAERLVSEGVTVHTPPRDILNVRSWENWSDIETLDNLDIVVNCAGSSTYSSVLDVPTFDEAMSFDEMVKGALNGVSWAVSRMSVRGGSIVNVTSVFGQRAGSGNAVLYQMAKAAIAQLTRNAAVRLAPKNIRVNAVCPGFIDTAMASPFHTNERYREFVLQGTPMKRMGRASEVASAVAFLVSDEASFITGVELAVDGGWLAR